MLEDIFTGTALAGEYAFVALCLGAAWAAGRSIANDWKPVWNLLAVTLLLAAGARFLHFALYQAPFLSLTRYLVDAVVLGVFVWLGWRYTRTGQMTRQYHWLYEKTSPFGWRNKS
ncbi:DUF6867 family protein [Aestuariivirga sp.]|uniref:DUF6867 family protein n=1 Tax=Aestuariivirga sp. TaxID=2650926 RepID=UPI0039E3E9D5